MRLDHALLSGLIVWTSACGADQPTQSKEDVEGNENREAFETRALQAAAKSIDEQSDLVRERYYKAREATLRRSVQTLHDSAQHLAATVAGLKAEQGPPGEVVQVEEQLTRVRERAAELEAFR